MWKTRRRIVLISHTCLGFGHEGTLSATPGGECHLPQIAFSLRKQNITFYIGPGSQEFSGS